MSYFVTLEKEMQKIEKNSKVNIILKEIADDGINNINHVAGTVCDNDLKQVHIIDEISSDTTIRYDQIKSVEVF